MRFFLRMGDSARERSVSILRQLFYPTSTSKLQVSLTVIDPEGRGKGLQQTPIAPASHMTFCSVYERWHAFH